jgi:tetratricopeptide (TPR) repeat protein
MDALIGQTLAGRYKIVSSLGGGAFGQTYIANDLQLPDHPRCVVKQLQPQSSDPLTLETARRLFDTEAKVLHRLGSHDQIPRLLAHFEENQEFYLVQDCIEGEPLSHEIRPGQQLSQLEVFALLQDVLSTLAFVHRQNVIHRDIKPSNLIRRVSDQKLVLIDFGAVKQVSNQGMPDDGRTVAIGTPGYMPSEQLAGQPRPNSDIYALGVIAIQALTGIIPSRLQRDVPTGELLWREQAQVKEELAAIIDKMVRYNFLQRYQTAQEVLADLETLQNSTGDPTQVSSVNWNSGAKNWAGELSSQQTNAQKGSTVQQNLTTLWQHPSRKLWWTAGTAAFVTGILMAGLVWFPRPDTLMMANQFIDEQKPSEAITAVDKILRTQPKNARAWKIRGNALYILERYEAALVAYEKALALDPKNPKLWNNQGETLYQLKRYQEALKAHDQAIQIAGDDFQAYNGRGLALLGLQRYQEALEAFNQARQIDPSNPLSWENRGLALEYLGKNQEARSAYEEALASYSDQLSINSRDLQALVNRGRVLSKLKRHSAALESFEQAIKIKPEYFPAWIGKGSTLILLQRPQEALSAYDKALELRPQSHITWHNRGSLLASMQRYEEALENYNQALEIENNFYPAMQDRGFTLLQLQRPKDALLNFDQARKIEPNDTKSWIGQGLALVALNRNEEALNAFNQSLQLNSNDPGVWLNKGLTLEKLQRNDEALEAYNQAIAISPTFQPALDARTKLRQKLGI